MINLATRDIAHSWGRFVLTGLGLGLLIGLTLSMAGIYRGLVDDGRVLLRNSGADLWVVQQDTQGPYAESSSLRDDVVHAVRGLPGVARAANVTYLTMQVGQAGAEVRAMVVGFLPLPARPRQRRSLRRRIEHRRRPLVARRRHLHPERPGSRRWMGKCHRGRNRARSLRSTDTPLPREGVGRLTAEALGKRAQIAPGHSRGVKRPPGRPLGRSSSGKTAWRCRFSRRPTAIMQKSRFEPP